MTAPRETCISCELPRATAADWLLHDGPCMCSTCTALCWRRDASECARATGRRLLGDPRAQLAIPGFA